ncbi:MAG: chalcone isomerase family protein [Candidatus Eisenbacteria bacterium]|uniref:Chalcone isomerase family protein n=1 Tax=Eiseniibacteriota bacterium TaxID=2212470 RepID=A0A956LW34_UNCEI|nr:chalcone isomerase family protein [Candidatus Eisenbacteria bacterium]
MADSLKVDQSVVHLYHATIKEATVLQVDVYAIGLYLEDTMTAPEEVLRSEQIKAVEITFLIAVKKLKLASAWMRDFQRCCPESCRSLRESAQALTKKLPDIKRGDRVSYRLHPDRVDVLINDRSLGALDDSCGAVAVLSAFIGERAPERLRQALLAPPPPAGR